MMSYAWPAEANTISPMTNIPWNLNSLTFSNGLACPWLHLGLREGSPKKTTNYPLFVDKEGGGSSKVVKGRVKKTLKV